MRVANTYSHLNGYEFLLVHKPDLWHEIVSTINSIDANTYTKISNDRTKRGQLVYDQKTINRAIKDILTPLGWHEVRTPYFVSSDIDTLREISGIRDKDEQKRVIEGKGLEPMSTYNQVDFVKDRVAIEVQFGKYFSVAYDLHVKHTFFFLRNDIDVGIEIIPTRAMCRKMDTGVAWFENEVANVVREGRSNPTVPLIMIGIEPETIEI